MVALETKITARREHLKISQISEISKASCSDLLTDCSTTLICMARPSLLLLLTLTAVSLDSCQAINCFIRAGTSTADNGTAQACASATACYSVTTNGVNFAGCTSSGQCGSSGPDCYVCSTDYCNSMSPSSISCFYRSGSYSTTDNGTVLACHSGVSACYSYIQSGSSSSYAGCANSSNSISIHLKQPFITCNSSLCNSRTPSAISCFAGSRSVGSTNNGSVLNCPTGIKTCYTLDPYFDTHGSVSGSHYSGCGTCNSTANPTCMTCSSDLCNSVTPSAISCYRRQLLSGSAITNGEPESCQHGITTCYSFIANYSHSILYFGGCGSCSSETIPSCQTCTGDYCNTMDTGALTCAVTSNGYSYNYVSCARGINSCYSLTKHIGWLTPNVDNFLGGCGFCTSTTSALYGCTMCNTSNCNYVAPATAAPANPSNSPINCYYGFGETGVSGPQTVSCPSSTSCFDFLIPLRSLNYGLKNFYFSGCGSCQSNNGEDCRTCSSSLCNSPRRKSGTKCYFSFGGNWLSKSIVDCPSSTSCFNFTYKSGLEEVLFAGCGNCTFDSGTTNCRTCFTDLCNSGSALGCSTAAAAAAAAAVVFGLNIIKLF